MSTLLTTTIAKNSNDTADATQQHHQHYHHDFDIHKKADTNSKVIRGCGNNNVRIITQNVDGLHLRTKCHWDYKTNLIEAHGHVGLYKCIPMEDSDTDSDSDDDNDRLVKLGSLRKYRTLLTKRRNSCCKRVSCGACGLARDQCQCDSVVCRSHDDRYCNAPPQSILVPKNDTPSSLSCHHHNNGGCNRKVPICMYEMEQSIPANKLEPCETRDILSSTRPSRDTKPIENTMLPISSSRPAAHQQVALSKLLLAKRSLPTTTFAPLTIPASPKCPSCHRPCPPQALLFDEGYHSHSHYQFIQMESWIANADILVFVGTSFSVTITNVALRHAMERNIPVYNFNLLERLNSTVRLNVENIMGDASETLMELLNVTKEVVERLQQQQQHDASIVN